MSETRNCPACGTEIPANAPAALCPQCLLQVGLESQSAADQGSGPAVGGEGVAAQAASGKFVPPAPEELAARFPQLEILELLGQGGMGAVYKARQKGLDRLVAVKILPPEDSRQPSFAERFTREARALAKLNHPHIVNVYDFGQTDGLYYFVMEYVDGVNLRQAILAGGLTSEKALAIVPQICEALQFAHDEGVVHRDIKPENILIDKKGRVKIADFGLAKLLGREQTDCTLTGTHQVMGTLRYMAPEQMEGTHAVDHRADIYSLGVVFYELLTGELPIGRFAPPSKKVHIDVRLDEVVLRALENRPEQRYQQASDVKTDIDTIRMSSRSAGAMPSALPGVTDDVLRRRVFWMALVTISLAEAMFVALQVGYLKGADWFFKKELPYDYLSTGLQIFGLMGFAQGMWWWYLLAKDPHTPRSLQDFGHRFQTPDPRLLEQMRWVAGLLLTFPMLILMSMVFDDRVQTLLLTVIFGLFPYVCLAVLWKVYQKHRAGEATRLGTQGGRIHASAAGNWYDPSPSPSPSHEFQTEIEVSPATPAGDSPAGGQTVVRLLLLTLCVGCLAVFAYIRLNAQTEHGGTHWTITVGAFDPWLIIHRLEGVKSPATESSTQPWAAYSSIRETHWLSWSMLAGIVAYASGWVFSRLTWGPGGERFAASWLRVPGGLRSILKWGLGFYVLGATIWVVSFTGKATGGTQGMSQLVEIGALDPWFRYAQSPQGFNWTISFLSLSSLIAYVAFLALWLLFKLDRIEKKSKQQEAKVPAAVS